jgi:hypothetical protein
MDVIGVGKIGDIFAHRGITKEIHTESNMDGINQTLKIMENDFTGLCFVNLVDFDMKYGHRRDIKGYAEAVMDFDSAISVFEKVKYVDTDSIRTREINIDVPSNRPNASEIPLAKKYNDLHLAGKDEEIPYKGMALTTEVARAARIMRLKDGPDSFAIPLSAFAIGNIAFVGLAGEPFTGIGLGLKANKNFELVLPAALTNGSEGYFPMMDSYTEGGYESATSNFKAGVAEYLIEKGNELLDSL